MADRSVYNSGSTGPVSGNSYMDQIAGHIGTIYNNTSLIPTNITNSGNDYTLTLDPVLDDDVASGMSFFIKPNANNTDAVRIRADASLPFYDCVKSTGEALAADGFDSDTVYFVVFTDGEFRIMSEAGAADTGATLYRTEYTTTTVWNKPTGLPENALAFIEIWGGGGGGAASTQRAGGGGGAYNSRIMLVSDLGASETVSIGSGGSVGAAGGITSFGSHLYAYGGGAGSNATISASIPSGGGGGGGGGQETAGQNGQVGTNANQSGGNGGMPSRGFGKNNETTLKNDGAAGMANGNSGGGGGASHGGGGAIAGAPPFNYGGEGIFGGGGGAGSGYSTNAAGGGGGSVYGGGGGGGGNQASGVGLGGTSQFGGDGGNAGSPGTVPAGGGGAGAAGAAGMAIITIIA